MAAWNSSSLAFSDHNNMRNGSSLLKNLSTRISKQHLVEHKMFGSKRKNIQIGKKFKGLLGKKSQFNTGPITAKMPKSSGISPSLAEFDKMMSSVTGSKNSKSSNSMSPRKKTMFSRKQFG